MHMHIPKSGNHIFFNNRGGNWEWMGIKQLANYKNLWRGKVYKVSFLFHSNSPNLVLDRADILHPLRPGSDLSVQVSARAHGCD